MWDKWRKKIRDFIWEEIEVEEEIIDEDVHQSPKVGQHINTKMVYRYPKQESFQFPVTPNERSRNKQSLDIPAYKRRVSNQKPKQERPIEQEKQEKKHPTVNSDSKQKVYKKDTSRPFKPSKVASPIYGYQPRKNAKDIQEVPTYLRKQVKNQKPANEKEIEKPKLEQGEQKSSDLVSMDQKVMEDHSKKRETTETPSQRSIQEKDSSLEAKKDSPKVDNGKAGALKRELKNKQQVNHPFNVIMTPRDKKNLRNRQQQAHDNKESPLAASEIAATLDEEVSMPYYLLDEPETEDSTNDLWIVEQQELLEQTLSHFNVKATVVNAVQGPSVTRFEVKPELGVKVSRIRNLSDDLKLNMAAKDIRIEAPIPGKNTVGIEVPNLYAQMVRLQEIFNTDEFQKNQSPLTAALGLNIEGSPIVTNIQEMPHGLIAGATGSGKSVCINTILISLLYKANPADVKLLLIDPKMVELAQYNGIPHLVSPVITDVKAANAALKWAVNEMEERYVKFVNESVRNVEKYNQHMEEMGTTDEKMPYIVIVIDELADLMMVAPQDVEDSISRIAQKARACGIHLLVATQRPSVDVITGLIKANIPTRIAFSVSSQVDSRTIIDTAGAEKLLGKGDMLFVENGAGQSIRLQGAFVSDEEIHRVTAHTRKIASPNYLFEQESLLEEMAIEEEDELLQAAIDLIIDHDSASTSMLQRHFKIGYNRAARLIDTLEERGIVTSQNGSKPRNVLVTKQQVDEMYGQ